MIFSILFILLFLFTILFILVFLFGIMLLAMKSEKIGIQNPVFSPKEINYVVKQSDTIEPDLTKKAYIQPEKINDETKRRLVFDGLKNCALFFSTYESEFMNSISCAGFGDCISVCHQRSISIKNGIAVINETCDGCGACISVCPRKLISLIPASQIKEAEKKKDFKFWYNCYRIIGKRS